MDKDYKYRFIAKMSKRKTKIGCVLWKGAIAGKGYGYFLFENKTISAHRMSYRLFNGIIPENFFVLHTCDNRKCVNPDHLFLGTNNDNVKDMVNKKRNSCGKGKNHGKAKLDDKTVKRIKILLSQKIPQKELARKFKISTSTISSIALGITWKNVCI